MSAPCAASWVWPIVFGIVTCCGPVDTDTFTVDPGGTFVPAAGSVPMTLPDGTVLLGALVNFGTRPAWERMLPASPWLLPLTSGTATPGATATATVTALPFWAVSPAAGSVAMTVPGAFWADSASKRVTVRPTRASAAVAWSMVWPTTLGTVEVNELTVSTIVLPLSARRPPAGSWLSTVPAFCELVSSWSWETLKPFCCNVVVASPICWFTTSGTSTRGGLLLLSPALTRR